MAYIQTIVKTLNKSKSNGNVCQISPIEILTLLINKMFQYIYICDQSPVEQTLTYNTNNNNNN